MFAVLVFVSSSFSLGVVAHGLGFLGLGVFSRGGGSSSFASPLCGSLVGVLALVVLLSHGCGVVLCFCLFGVVLSVVWGVCVCFRFSFRVLSACLSPLLFGSPFSLAVGPFLFVSSSLSFFVLP